MRTSETIDKFAAAMAAAQAELKNAAFDKENPHFRSRYATLAAVRDTVAPVLSKHGLSVVQATDFDGGAWLVQTRIIHASGQWIESVYPFAIDKPQQMGSALTYARRYSLSMICGIASEEDDDGNEAQKGEQRPASPAPRPQPMTAANGTVGASKAANRGTYEKLVKAFRDAPGKAALKQTYKDNITEIDAMPPDWVDELRVEYEDRLSELDKQAAA